MKTGPAFLFALSCLTAFLPGEGTAGEKVALPTKPVIELFTSQGCNSCPPADAFLGELADRGDIIALSWSVDYWDYLGWRDTFARPENTARQRAYNRALGLSGVYTPQMIIDGQVQVVGSRRDEALEAIQARLAAEPGPVTLSFTPGAGGAGSVTVAGAAAHVQATVWLVEFMDQARQDIGGGELKGNAFTYRHVVKSADKIGVWTGGSQDFALTPILPSSGAVRVVIVQEKEAGPILAAADVP